MKQENHIGQVKARTCYYCNGRNIKCEKYTSDSHKRLCSYYSVLDEELSAITRGVTEEELKLLTFKDLPEFLGKLNRFNSFL